MWASAPDAWQRVAGARMRRQGHKRGARRATKKRRERREPSGWQVQGRRRRRCSRGRGTVGERTVGPGGPCAPGPSGRQRATHTRQNAQNAGARQMGRPRGGEAAAERGAGGGADGAGKGTCSGVGGAAARSAAAPPLPPRLHTCLRRYPTSRHPPLPHRTATWLSGALSCMPALSGLLGLPAAPPPPPPPPATAGSSTCVPPPPPLPPPVRSDCPACSATHTRGEETGGKGGLLQCSPRGRVSQHLWHRCHRRYDAERRYEACWQACRPARWLAGCRLTGRRAGRQGLVG